MEKHPYEQLIETVADKMKQHEDDNLGFGIFEKVDKDLGLFTFVKNFIASNTPSLTPLPLSFMPPKGDISIR